jgi:hypothetical protein
LRGLAVAQLQGVEKLLESALLGEAGSLNELLFEGVVWVVGHAKDDVANFGGEFG